MIGLFALDDDNNISFVQYGNHETITAIRVTVERYCIATLADGSEQMFTTELNEEILRTLQERSNLLIVHMRDDGTPVDQYDVPVTLAA